ncbi:MAG: tRNA (5-methylaminomethyl-2-thiouridine)(34)-methyltransferase MnmD [Candidatus Cyclobacteriaceae bacterium M3_2C_046]
MSNLKLILTRDGSHTLLNTTLNETYHSLHGAVQESKHVFIKHGLQYLHERQPKRRLNLLEIGFGTGLNTWLTLLWQINYKIPVNYIALEPHPLNIDLVKQLNYPESSSQSDIFLFEAIHAAGWGKPVEIEPGFTLTKLRDSLEKIDLQSEFNLVFFDAFAPSKQPDIWNLKNLKKIHEHLEKPGILVTYCSQGQFKRDLKGLGFSLEVLPGPPGKKEMVRAIRN